MSSYQRSNAVAGEEKTKVNRDSNNTVSQAHKKPTPQDSDSDKRFVSRRVWPD